MYIHKHLKLYLIDQDGVLADFETGFLEIWEKICPPEHKDKLKDRLNYFLEDNFPEEMKQEIISIYYQKEFFKKLKPIPGSIEAIKLIESRGHEIMLCTTPLHYAGHSLSEKHEWIETYLGKKYTKKVTYAYDKTIVGGDMLIDDRPDITGLREVPIWEHIVYDTSYNRHLTENKRIRWDMDNWQEILGI